MGGNCSRRRFNLTLWRDVKWSIDLRKITKWHRASSQSTSVIWLWMKRIRQPCRGGRATWDRVRIADGRQTGRQSPFAWDRVLATTLLRNESNKQVDKTRPLNAPGTGSWLDLASRCRFSSHLATKCAIGTLTWPNGKNSIFFVEVVRIDGHFVFAQLLMEERDGNVRIQCTDVCRATIGCCEAGC